MASVQQLYLKVPTEYKASEFRDIVLAITQQLESVSKSQTTSRYNASSETPSGNVAAYNVSDVLYDTNATVRASLVSGLPLNYVRLGWIWNVAGSPGTFQELRIPTGTLDRSVENKVVLAGDGAGGLRLRTLTSADVPAVTQFSITPTCHTLNSTVALSATASYFPVLTTASLSAGVYYAVCHASVLASGATHWNAKLWDGTTTFASARQYGPVAGAFMMISFSAVVVNPGGALTLAIQDTASTTGKVLPDSSGNGHDTMLTVLKIG